MKNKKHIETILDHNPTDEELEDLFGFVDRNRELYEQFSQLDNYVFIFKYYGMIGNEEKSKEYLDKIPDCEGKLFTLCNHDRF